MSDIRHARSHTQFCLFISKFQNKQFFSSGSPEQVRSCKQVLSSPLRCWRGEHWVGKDQSGSGRRLLDDLIYSEYGDFRVPADFTTQ